MDLWGSRNDDPVSFYFMEIDRVDPGVLNRSWKCYLACCDNTQYFHSHYEDQIELIISSTPVLVPGHEWSFATTLVQISEVVEKGVKVANIQLGIQITFYEKDEKTLSQMPDNARLLIMLAAQ